MKVAKNSSRLCGYFTESAFFQKFDNILDQDPKPPYSLRLTTSLMPTSSSATTSSPVLLNPKTPKHHIVPSYRLPRTSSTMPIVLHVPPSMAFSTFLSFESSSKIQSSANASAARRAPPMFAFAANARLFSLQPHQHVQLSLISSTSLLMLSITIYVAALTLTST